MITSITIDLSEIRDDLVLAYSELRGAVAVDSDGKSSDTAWEAYLGENPKVREIEDTIAELNRVLEIGMSATVTAVGKEAT